MTSLKPAFGFRRKPFLLKGLAWTAAVATGLVLSGAAAVPAQTQAMDEDFSRAVKEWTTRPEFLNALVDHLPKSATVPSPKDVLGDHIGKPDRLHDSGEIRRYFLALEAKSPRVKLAVIGRTEEGKEVWLAFISSEENIRNLETHRRDLERLGDPRTISEAEAGAIIARAKAIYHITGGVHAPETGSPEMLTELAFRLAVEESDAIRRIRENVITILTPVVDPDGRDRVVDWYKQSRTAEDLPGTRPAGVPYWGKYVFHDNNRDINFTCASGAAHLEFFLKWRPTVTHDLHESLPYLYIYSGFSVQDPGVDPLLLAELYWFSNYQKMRMVGFGMPGVWDHGTWDIWWPGYFSFFGAHHNAVTQMYETFGNGGPKTRLRNIAPPKPKPGDAPVPWHLAPDYTAYDWRRPLPAYGEVLWSARNNINYSQTGVLCALDLAATYRAVLLEQFYRKSRNAVIAGAAKAPYAFILPGGQSDPARVAFIVNTLRRQGIEVGEADAPFQAGGREFPAGSFVVKLNQPYGRLARILLERQVYAGDSKKLDDTAWTMGLMAHAEVVGSPDRSVLDVAVRPVDRYSPRGRFPGEKARFYAVLDHGSIPLAALRYRLGKTAVRIADEAFSVSGAKIPAGSLIVPASARVALEKNVVALGLTAAALDEVPAVALSPAPLPRLAVYSTWGSTQDVGWVRYALDQSEVVYDLIYKEQVRAGRLRERYDVIVIPSQGRGTPQSIVEDLPVSGPPAPYRKTAEYPSLGAYGSSPDIRGGLGKEGVAELRTFVEQGGLLITLGRASEIPPAYGWTPGITVSKPSADFRAVGPIVEAKIETPGHPLFYGYRETMMPVRWAGPALYAVAPEARADVLLSFPGRPDSLLSGEFIGIAETAGRPAVIQVSLGKGKCLLFATNPIFRHQNLGEYRLLFNAILNFRKISE